MTLLQMQYLLEIDRCGSMNRAAQSLYITQSALSSAIAEVERELGISVFRRTNRGTVPTEDGRELLAQIAPIVEQSRRLTRYYSRRRDEDMAHLSVAAQRYPFCAQAFVELLRSMEQPAAQMSLKEMDMAAVIAEVAAGTSDLGVIFLSDLTEAYIRRTLEEKNLEFEPLAALHPHVFMRKGHPLSGRESVTVEDLRAFPHVVFTRSENNLNFAEEAVAGAGLDFDRMVYVNDRATIYNVMVHTDCVSTGSGILPAGYSDERLAAVPLAEQRDMRLGLIRRRGHTASALEKEFVALLRGITGETGTENGKR